MQGAPGDAVAAVERAHPVTKLDASLVQFTQPDSEMSEHLVSSQVGNGKGVASPFSQPGVLALQKGTGGFCCGLGGHSRDQRDERVLRRFLNQRHVLITEGAQHQRWSLHARHGLRQRHACSVPTTTDPRPDPSTRRTEGIANRT